eukprot:XP_765023.1 hypothetical protein [Theileria parva strain Muguga]
MQYGFLKYDEWNDLIWIYNSISGSVTYNISGSLIGLNPEDKSIKHIHSLPQNTGPYSVSDDFNCYCGCFDNSIHSLAVYEEYLLVGKSKDLFVVSKDGYRSMKVLCSPAKEEITYGNTRHISCALFPTSKNDPKIVLSNNSDELFFIDPFKGQVKSKLNAQIENSTLEYRDKITSISDFMSNQSSSYCYYSYQPEYPTYETTDYTSAQYPSDYKNQDPSCEQYTPSTSNDSPSHGDKPAFSFRTIAEKYGDISSIPEFVPSSYSFTSLSNQNSYEQNNPNGYYPSQSFGYKPDNFCTYGTGFTSNRVPPTKAFVERANGAITLECILSEMKPSNTLQNDFVDSTCIGTCSGILHVVDNRINRIVSSVSSHSNPVYSISASNNTIATTSCTLQPLPNPYWYPYQYNAQSSSCSGCMTLFDPVLCLYDIRMMKSFSMIFHRPLSRVFIVPKSDRLFALSPDGNIFDLKISTLEYKMAREQTMNSCLQYGLGVVGNSAGDTLDVFMSDSSYNFESLRFPNELKEDFGFNRENLPRNLSEIPISQSREFNNTPFASMVGTFDGDVAHIFVQMFFFLPKLSSIQYHICELSNCITCQIGFGLHNLQVYYDNNKETSKDTTSDSKIRKFSNNLLYVTQLQELMLIENQPTLKTPIHLFLWVLEKMSTEMHNYYNKNNLKVTTSLIKDLFSFSKKTFSRCLSYNHVNVVVNVGNYCVDYYEITDTPKSDTTQSDNISMDFCKDCNKVVECIVDVEYLSSPNILIIDFINYRVENIPREMDFNDHKYTLECFYFTLPPENLHYRSLACIKLPPKYKVLLIYLVI